MRGERWLWWGAGLALAGGIAFRLWHVLAEPFWLDEAYSAFAADHDFGFLWRVVPRYETHPPFYYSLLHLWALAFGDGVVSLRLPGVLAGLATLPVVALAARRAAALLDWEPRRADRLTLAAVALAAAANQLVEMTRQVRPYPLMILAYALAIWLVLGFAMRARAGRPLGRGAIVGYLLLLEALLWLHNLGPLYAASLTAALGLVLWGRRLPARTWGWLALGHLLVGLAYLPGLAILRSQASGWIASTWVTFDLNILGHLQLLYAGAGPGPIAAAVLAGIAVAATWRVAEARRAVAMLLTLALLPLALSLAISATVAPVFITRTMAPVAVPAVLVYAVGAVAWADGRRWPALAGPIALVVLGLAMARTDLHDRRAGPIQDWYAVVDWLHARFRPGDVVLTYPNEGAVPLLYALRDRGLHVAVRAVPRPVPAFDEPDSRSPSGSRGVVALGPARIRAIAADPSIRAIPTIWLLRLDSQLYDPDDLFLREVARGRRPVGVWRFWPIEFTGLRRQDVPAPR